MLILSRQKGEAILIGNDITVTIIDVTPTGYVRLGIEAPKNVSVDRAEIRISKSVWHGWATPDPENDT